MKPGGGLFAARRGQSPKFNLRSTFATNPVVSWDEWQKKRINQSN